MKIELIVWRCTLALLLVVCAGCSRQASPTLGTSSREQPSSGEGTTGSVFRAAQEQIDMCARDGGSQLVVRTPVSAAQWSVITGFSQLDSLELFESHFAPSEFIRVSKLQHLRRLRIEDLSLNDAAVAQLAVLPELEVLNAPATVLSDAGLKSLVDRLPKLQLLRIGSPNISDSGMAIIGAMPSLRFLHLVNSPITDQGLLAFHQLPNLESLYIDGGKATERGIRDLMRANPTLHFHLNQVHVPDDPNADGH